MQRRRFLISLLVAGGYYSSSGCSLGQKANQDILVSAQGRKKDRYGLSWLSEGEVKTALSGFRGHGASQHPLRSTSVIMYARRPGTTGVEVNLQTGAIDKVFDCQNNRHMLGHGCFSLDGKTLFTTEADYQNGTGKIGIRDALSYQQIGEYDSHGIGPHELKLMPDGKTLVIANGGILTHPNSSRKELNLNSMSSSLTYLDIENGQKLDDFRVAENKASIRHLDVAADGTVAFAMQMQRKVADHEHTVALGGIHKPGQAIQLLEQPEVLIDQMKDYMGSVAINDRTRTAGFTSPRGDVAAFWNIDSGELQGHHALHDVCGIATTSDQRYFILTNSFGQIRQLDAMTLKENPTARSQLAETYWDNHLLVASL